MVRLLICNAPFHARHVDLITTLNTPGLWRIRLTRQFPHSNQVWWNKDAAEMGCLQVNRCRMRMPLSWTHMCVCVIKQAKTKKLFEEVAGCGGSWPSECPIGGRPVRGLLSSASDKLRVTTLDTTGHHGSVFPPDALPGVEELRAKGVGVEVERCVMGKLTLRVLYDSIPVSYFF